MLICNHCSPFDQLADLNDDFLDFFKEKKSNSITLSPQPNNKQAPLLFSV